MAKVTGALFSLEASGKFANALVFDRRGYVRGYKRPNNPQTAPQGNVRQVMLAAQRALGVAGATTKTGIKELAPVDYRWNSYLIQQLIGKGSVEWDASLAAFNALDAADQDAWTAEATSLGIPEISIPYAGDPRHPGGGGALRAGPHPLPPGHPCRDRPPGWYQRRRLGRQHYELRRISGLA